MANKTIKYYQSKRVLIKSDRPYDPAAPVFQTGVFYEIDGAVKAESFIGSITGNSDTASSLIMPRNISIVGDGEWTVSFDGSSDVSASMVLTNTGVTAGEYTKVTVDTKGRVTSGTILVSSDIPFLDASKINTGVFAAARIPEGIDITGNADTASRLETPASISMTGDGAWTVSFDGSTGVSSPLTLSNTGVVAGQYTKVTVDTKGRVTTASNLVITDIPDRAIANGLATLDSNGKVPLEQLSDAVLGQVIYLGTWNALSNTPNLPSTPVAKGDYYVVNTAGTQFGIDFQVGDWIISNGTSWEKVDNTDSVTSVAGKVGAVVLTKVDVGLSNVDNTSDINKPISNATQSALNDKVDKVVGKQLSTEDYTTAEKSKLAGIQVGAEVNQNAFSVIAVTGQSSVEADSKTDTLTLVAGSNISITTNASTDAITISSSFTDTTYTAGTGITLVGTTFSLSDERYTTSEKNKLSGIESGAQVNVATNLSIGANSSTTLRIDSSTGANVTLNAATTTNAGLMSAADKSTINNLSGTYLPLTGGTLTGNLTVNGAVVAQTYDTSSIRYKSQIINIGNIDDVLELEPKYYYHKHKKRFEYGLIAEETVKVYPEIVFIDESGQPYGIDYSKLSVMLLAKVKQLDSEIKRLKGV